MITSAKVLYSSTNLSTCALPVYFLLMLHCTFIYYFIYNVLWNIYLLLHIIIL